MAHYEKAGQIRVEVEIGKAVLRRFIDRRLKVGGASPSVGSTSSSWNPNVTNVVSMALDSVELNALYGAMRYAQLLPVLLPAWRLRVYVRREGAPRAIRVLARKLEGSGVEVVRVGNKTAGRLAASLWRYLVVDDPRVTRCDRSSG